MLTGPDKTSASVTAENVRQGVGAFHPSGCSGNAKQVDEQVHEVYLHCALVQGDRYKIWLVKDEDYNGHNSHVVTPDGVPLLVPCNILFKPPQSKVGTDKELLHLSKSLFLPFLFLSTRSRSYFVRSSRQCFHEWFHL